ncbi:hypothetical protein ACH4F6_37860 [Streptomyces sp. NPDC017936]|uniref:hypothetical protein n=1 Tax=Streptomyces sp. NPDC017936 TaxID=3365016 RepID=UPI0037877E09
MTTRTGPQTYPGASTAYWYGDDYDGSAMEVNVVVLHTTEGATLPGYGGGASAPTLTAVPDFAAKRLRWYQHFGIDTSARALLNLPGGVETNTANVCQVELVGTCDPATHARWAKAGIAHIYWPEAPEWALQGVADFLRWMNAEHGVPLTGPSQWPAYPSSYGATSARLTFSQWRTFTGVCGHMHVPENLHGDPGSIDFARLLTLARGTDEPAAETPTPEDDMPQMLNESNAKDVALKSGVWTGLALTDAVLHTGPRLHDTLVHVTLDDAAAPETKVEGRFYLTDTSGSSPSAYQIVTRRGGGGHQFALSGVIPADRHLRFEIRVTTPDGSPVTLLHRTVSGPYWAAA